jgi:hypothetical protein
MIHDRIKQFSNLPARAWLPGDGLRPGVRNGAGQKLSLLVGLAVAFFMMVACAVEQRPTTRPLPAPTCGPFCWMSWLSVPGLSRGQPVPKLGAQRQTVRDPWGGRGRAHYATAGRPATSPNRSLAEDGAAASLLADSDFERGRMPDSLALDASCLRPTVRLSASCLRPIGLEQTGRRQATP